MHSQHIRIKNIKVESLTCTLKREWTLHNDKVNYCIVFARTQTFLKRIKSSTIKVSSIQFSQVKKGFDILWMMMQFSSLGSASPGEFYLIQTKVQLKLWLIHIIYMLNTRKISPWEYMFQMQVVTCPFSCVSDHKSALNHFNFC